jgi:putative transposase
VRVMCRMFDVSASGFYAWQGRPMSRRAIDDEVLTETIRSVHERSRRTYGAPRVHAELRMGLGINCSRKRVARLMRCHGIQGAYRRSKRRATIADRNTAPHPDYVLRRFTAPAPDRLWVADITYIPTGENHLYLASVLDVFTRRIVGWSMAEHLRTELVVAALEMAMHNRAPAPGLIHHSDRGCQYASFTFGRRCVEAGIVPSMGRTGSAHDNAMAEAFFATLEKELLDLTRFKTRNEARRAIFDYIEVFYNRQRRHSKIGNRSPDEFERRWQLTVAAEPQGVNVA